MLGDSKWNRTYNHLICKRTLNHLGKLFSQFGFTPKRVRDMIRTYSVGFGVEEFVRLKPKMYSFLVDNKSEHKKSKGVNRNVVTRISHNEYKDALSNNKCIRHSMNKIQSKDT